MLLPPNPRILKHDIKVFKPAMNNYHLTHSFKSVEEFLSTIYTHTHTHTHIHDFPDKVPMNTSTNRAFHICII